MSLPSIAPEKQPYKFLDYFEERDEDAFFGRERDVEKIVTRIAKDRISVLYGRSGVGKTSLFRAGVIPALRRRKYLPVYVRVTRFAAADLAAAVAAELGAPAPPVDLAGFIREASASRPMVLLFDQVEEFFVETDAPDRRKERDEFIALVKALVDDETLRLRLAFGVREEYLARLEAIKDLHDGLLRNAERLQPLSAFGAREAVVGPLEKLGIRYSDKFADRLVDALAEVGFDTPTLQIVCQQVYLAAKERDPAAPYLDEQALDRLGGIDGIYERYLEGVTSAIPPEQQFVARAVVEALITREQTKRAATLEMLREGRLLASDGELRAAIAALTGRRLVRVEERGGGVWYELAHERVIKSALEWLDRDESFFNFRSTRELVLNLSRGERWRRQPKMLLTADQLDLVNPHVGRLKLERVERDFLAWSAIFRGSKASLGIYTTASPPGEIAVAAEALLRHGDPLLRRAAAAALGSGDVRDSLGALMKRCLDMALEDGDDEARRAAARAFARAAKDVDLVHLSAVLSPKALDAEAEELLTEVAAARLGTPGEAALRQWVPPAHWKRVTKAARARILAEHREVIKKRRGLGAVRGLLAAVGWALLFGAPLWCALLWDSEPRWQEAAIYLIPITVGLAMFLGPTVGALAGAAGARAAALRGEGRWSRALGTWRTTLPLAIVLWGLFAGISIIADAASLSNHEWQNFGSEAGVLLVLLAGEAAVAPLLAFGVLLPIAASAHLAEAAGAASDSTPRAIFWCLAAAAGLPLFALMLFMAFGTSMGLAILTMFSAELVPLFVLPAVASLRAGAAVAPIQRAPAAPSAPEGWARALSAVPLGLAVIGGLWVFEWRSIPFFAPIVEITAEPSTLRAPERRMFFGLFRYKLHIHAGDEEIALVRFTRRGPPTTLSDTSTKSNLTPGDGLNPVDLFAVSPGTWTVAAGSEKDDLVARARSNEPPAFSVQRVVTEPVPREAAVEVQPGWQLFSLQRALGGEDLALSLRCPAPAGERRTIDLALIATRKAALWRGSSKSGTGAATNAVEELAARATMESPGVGPIGFYLLDLPAPDEPRDELDRDGAPKKALTGLAEQLGAATVQRPTLRPVTNDRVAGWLLGCPAEGTAIHVRVRDPQTLRAAAADVALAVHVGGEDR
jgi:hypothetical protein